MMSLLLDHTSPENCMHKTNTTVNPYYAATVREIKGGLRVTEIGHLIVVGVL